LDVLLGVISGEHFFLNLALARARVHLGDRGRGDRDFTLAQSARLDEADQYGGISASFL